MTTKSPIRIPKPFEQESITDYIQRTAFVNNYENANWIYTIAGIKRNVKKGPFIEEDLILLANFFQEDAAELRKLTFLKNFPSNNPLQKYIFKYGITTHSKYCPQCFNQQNFHNKYWDVSFNFACYKHGLLLIGYCPNCKKALSSKLQHMNYCLCGFPLKDLPIIKIEDDHAANGLLIEDIFERNENSNASVLYTLSPIEFSCLIIFILQQLCYEKHNKWFSISSDFNKSSEYSELIIRAFKMFQNWPYSYYEFLEEFGQKKKRKDRKTGLSTYFGRYYIQLYSQLNNPCYDFLRDGFEDYIKENFYKVYFSRLSNFNASNGSTKYISGNEASEILKVNLDYIPKLINQDKIKGHIEVVGKQTFISVEYKSLVQYKQLKESSLKLKEVVALLGINRKRIIELFKGSLLVGFEETTPTFNYIFFSSKSVFYLLDQFEYQFSLEKNNKKDLISFNSCIRTWGCRKRSICELVENIVLGKIRPIEKSPGIGLNSYLFSKSDIDRLAEDILRNEIKTHYSCKEVCLVLKTEHAIVKKWMDNGLLKSKKLNRKNVIINSEDLENFKKQYITLPEIAKRLNGNSRTILNPEIILRK